LIMSDARKRQHIFFDTTELALSDKDWPKLGRISSKRFLKAAHESEAIIYVTDLTLDELAYRHFRELKKDYDTVVSLGERLKSSITFSVDKVDFQKDSERFVRRFRDEIEDKVRHLPVEIIPAKAVNLEEVLELSRRRIPPFKRDDNPTGFHDAVILLASLKFAQTQRIDNSFFVSSDPAYTEPAIESLARNAGIVCRLITNADSMAEMLEKMLSANISSLESSESKAAMDFMNANLKVLQDYWAAHPLKLDDVAPFIEGASPVQIHSVVVQPIHTAFPVEKLRNGAECQLSFFTELLVEILVFRAPSYYTQAGFSVKGVTWAQTLQASYNTYGGFPVYGATPLPLQAATGFAYNPNYSGGQVKIPIAGKAKGRFEGGQFVGVPTIEAIAVSTAEAESK